MSTLTASTVRSSNRTTVLLILDLQLESPCISYSSCTEQSVSASFGDRRPVNSTSALQAKWSRNAWASSEISHVQCSNGELLQMQKHALQVRTAAQCDAIANATAHRLSDNIFSVDTDANTCQSVSNIRC